MKIFFSTLFLVLYFQAAAQETYTETALKSIFPERCLGIWEGMMHMYKQGQLVDSVLVHFTAAKTDTAGTYIWKTEYLSPTRPVTKDYKLVVDDIKTGRYILDEGDGVTLLEYNIADKLYCSFKVGESYLTSTTERIGDVLIFEVTSGKSIDEDGDIINHVISNVQRVEMQRIAKK